MTTKPPEPTGPGDSPLAPQTRSTNRARRRHAAACFVGAASIESGPSRSSCRSFPKRPLQGGSVRTCRMALITLGRTGHHNITGCHFGRDRDHQGVSVNVPDGLCLPSSARLPCCFHRRRPSVPARGPGRSVLRRPCRRSEASSRGLQLPRCIPRQVRHARQQHRQARVGQTTSLCAVAAPSMSSVPTWRTARLPAPSPAPRRSTGTPSRASGPSCSSSTSRRSTPPAPSKTGLGS